MRLAKLLGQDQAAELLLERAADLGNISWLVGPSGSGKTEVAKLAARQWPGQTVWLRGCRDLAALPYQAAYQALCGTRQKRVVRDLTRDEGVDFVRDVPFIGNTLAMLAKQITARKGERGPDFLSYEQQDLLSGFQNLCRASNSLFVVDDVNWLDDKSAELLAIMRMGEVKTAYAYTQAASFLFIETSDQPVNLPESILRRLRPSSAQKVATHYPSRRDFPDVLHCLGLKTALPLVLCDRLYNLTRGHLKLAREIVRLVQHGVVEPDQIVSRHDSTIDELAVKLLQMRLADLPQSTNGLERLLTIAACAGRQFSLEELRCAFDEPGSFAATLDLAKREEYLTEDGDTLRFAHDIVQSAMRRIDSSEKAAYHDKLAECVRLLRPGDYGTRLFHSQLGSNPQRTAELSFALLLQAARGEESASVHQPTLEAALGPLEAVFNATRVALRAMDHGRPHEAITVLIPFYDDGHGLPQAEVSYLLALNYYKCRSAAGYESAKAILEPWIQRREEGEAWYRLMLTLAVVYTSLDNRYECAHILQRVRLYLERAMHRDPTARSKIQVLNRKAEPFYPLEVAGTLIQHSADYFAPPPGARFPRNAFQYTASLVNLAGNLYVRGEFAQSAIEASRAIGCISELSIEFRLVEPYKAFNNYAISAFRAGQLSAEEAEAILSAVCDATPADQLLDRSLLYINRSALAALAGNVEAADELLSGVLIGLRNTEAEGYYVVFAASNLAATRYLLGSPDEAMSLLNEVESQLDSLSSELRGCHKARTCALRSLFDRHKVTDPIALDQHPQNSDSGPHIAWKSIGRGFLMSDIQVWSES